MTVVLKRVLVWMWVVGVAFLLADLTSASLEGHLMLPAPRVSPSQKPGAALSAAPAAAIPGELVSVLDTHPPEAVIDTSTGGDTSAPVAATTAGGVTLKLKGTLIGAGGVSLALVDDGSGETKLVSMGEQIGDMTLVDVGPQEATFRRGNELQKLTLLDDGSKTVAMTPAVNTSAAVAPTPSAPIKPPETMAEVQELLNNPAAASEGFKFTPINRKGESYGVMLEFRKANNLMAAIGLRHGDILLSVNGRPLKSGEDMYTAYQELRNSPTVSFEVDRGGQVVPVKFEVKP